MHVLPTQLRLNAPDHVLAADVDRSDGLLEFAIGQRGVGQHQRQVERRALHGLTQQAESWGLEVNAGGQARDAHGLHVTRQHVEQGLVLPAQTSGQTHVPGLAADVDAGQRQ